MIDYARVEGRNTISTNQLTLLRRRTVEVPGTSGVSMLDEYRLGPLKIFQFENKFEVVGSIHYFSNWLHNGELENNHTQFTYLQFCTAVDTLSEMLQLNCDELKLKGYEYGANLSIQYNPKQLLEKNLIGLRRPTKSIERNHDKKGYFIGYGKDDRIIKLYDKAKQKGIEGNILRIECKVIKSRAYEDITSIRNLKEKKNWQFFRDELIKVVDKDMVIIDYPEKYPMKSNPKYWQSLKCRMERKRAYDGLPLSSLKKDIIEAIRTTSDNLLFN